MKRFSSSKIGIPIAALAVLGLAVLNPLLRADDYNHKTVFTINQPLEVPGVVLAPGTYVMRLLNSASDRHIVQFMTEDQKKQLALTFAIPADRVTPSGKTILTMYEGSQGSPQALRTWIYPGETVGEEFLYPHRQAVRISERTNQQVPEVETGEAASAKETASAAPAAEPAQSSQSPGESVFIAKAEPAPEPAPAPIAAPEPQQPAAEPQSPAANSTQSPDATPAATPAAPADESLPKTASNGPLAALIGGLSIVLAFGLRKMTRRRTTL